MSYFYIYIVLLPKPRGRAESPFLMKISGLWFRQRNPPPVTTTKGLLPSALPEPALLRAMHQLEIKKGHLTILLLFSILVKAIIPCSAFKKYEDSAVCEAVFSWTR